MQREARTVPGMVRASRMSTGNRKGDDMQDTAIKIEWRAERYNSTTVWRDGEYFGHLSPYDLLGNNVRFTRMLGKDEFLHVDIYRTEVADQVALLAKYLP
jgi:hypothetical protein